MSLFGRGNHPLILKRTGLLTYQEINACIAFGERLLFFIRCIRILSHTAWGSVPRLLIGFWCPGRRWPTWLIHKSSRRWTSRWRIGWSSWITRLVPLIRWQKKPFKKYHWYFFSWAWGHHRASVVLKKWQRAKKFSLQSQGLKKVLSGSPRQVNFLAGY